MRRLIYVDGIPENHPRNSRQLSLDQRKLTEWFNLEENEEENLTGKMI